MEQRLWGIGLQSTLGMLGLRRHLFGNDTECGTLPDQKLGFFRLNHGHLESATWSSFHVL
jgi:hypothetical protein